MVQEIIHADFSAAISPPSRCAQISNFSTNILLSPPVDKYLIELSVIRISYHNSNFQSNHTPEIPRNGLEIGFSWISNKQRFFDNKQMFQMFRNKASLWCRWLIIMYNVLESQQCDIYWMWRRKRNEIIQIKLLLTSRALLQKEKLCCVGTCGISTLFISSTQWYVDELKEPSNTYAWHFKWLFKYPFRIDWSHR